MKHRIRLPDASYDVVCESGALSKIRDYFPLDRKVLVVTDAGVPSAYAEAVMAAAAEPYLAVVPEGEGSKSFACMEALCRRMMEAGFTRRDCVVNVGGGMPSDLAGFAAATYMRGIDFYSVPTTILAAADASVGGKCAINLAGVKNIVGAFHQPSGVVYDPLTVRTLSKEQIGGGMAEIIKMALTFDRDFFCLLETTPFDEQLLTLAIHKAAQMKGVVVEADEREGGLRKVLNLGHTLGHAIESAAAGGLSHGACVALGMLPVLPEGLWQRLRALMQTYGLPTALPAPLEDILPICLHDKKKHGDTLDIIFVPEVGAYEIRPLSAEAWFDTVRAAKDRFDKQPQ